MKRFKSLFIILIFIIIFILFYFLKFEWYCPIKKLTGIRCPGCGLTRSILALIDLDFISSFKYNILGLPIVIFSLISCIFLVKDFIKNEDKYLKNIEIIFGKNWFIILLIIVITMIINNVNLV